ncbi:MAG: UDP-3-O-(3-hydroxymyristoyl)glucosamine N-acyltransferase [Phycisphaerae bacterium]
MLELTLAELAEKLGGSLQGDGDTVVTGVASLQEAADSEISFLANPRYVSQMESTSAAAVIVSEDYDGPGPALIRCEDPYFAFRNAMVLFYGFREPEFEGIDERANIADSAEIGENARIAAFVTVADAAIVGDNCVLYPGVYIGPGAKIGDDCILHANTVIYDGCVLGDRVTLHANCTIGQDGFGYATHQGRHHKIPVAGIAEIGDDVEMGANCSVDRATLGATKVGSGTKFSNSVTIGHGTTVGRGCLFVAQVGIAGSAEIGDYCVFGGQTGVAGHLKVTGGVMTGGKTIVTSEVKKPGKYWGYPAIPLEVARKVAVTQSKLPEMRREMRRMSRELEQMRRLLRSMEAENGDDE